MADNEFADRLRGGHLVLDETVDPGAVQVAPDGAVRVHPDTDLKALIGIYAAAGITMTGVDFIPEEDKEPVVVTLETIPGGTNGHTFVFTVPLSGFEGLVGLDRNGLTFGVTSEAAFKMWKLLDTPRSQGRLRRAMRDTDESVTKQEDTEE